MRNQLRVFIQYIVPQHGLSRFAGWVAECRIPWLKNWIIRRFIKKYNVDMSVVPQDAEAYPSFNAFFTRHLKPTARPIVQASNQIASPADGTVSQIGKIEQNTLLQAKGFHFDLVSLLGGLQDEAKLFYDGCFATLYLAPRDYHRVHMPFSGSLRATTYIPGQLFSVNNQTACAVPHLFSRNERLVCLFDTDIGPMAVILVGAMLVGKMNTVWPQETHGRKIITQTLANPIKLLRGEELGHFKMGSTVIVLFAKDKINWAPHLQENSSTHMGQLLATVC